VMIFLYRDVDCGSIHEIDHMLGPIVHVNQGKTPCILLPAVCNSMRCIVDLRSWSGRVL
jgi:alcohol dehydrogenase class IV